MGHLKFFFNIKKLLSIGGVFVNSKNTYFNRYLTLLFLGQKGNLSIINYDILLEYIQLVRIFIFNLLKVNGNILFYDNSSRFENILSFYTKFIGQQYVVGRWIPGTLTNYRMLHYNYINNDSFLLAKYPTAVFFLTEKDNDVLLKECYKFNIPVLSIVNLNTRSLFYYTYIIPGSCRSYKFTLFIFYLLHYYLRKYLFFFKIQKKKLGKSKIIKQRNNYFFKLYYNVMLYALKLHVIYDRKMALPKIRSYTKKRWTKLLYSFFKE